MPIDRPARPPAPHITPQITQAILNWIAHNVEHGLIMLDNLYLEAEVHPNHRDALIELEDRYARVGELYRDYLARLKLQGQYYAKKTRIPKMIALEAYTDEELINSVPRGPRAEAFLHCLPEPELITALELGARTLSEQPDQADLFGYLENVFRARELPYTASEQNGISWVSEAAVRELAIDPALAGLTDPRLSTARKEFDKARGHLRRGELKDAGKAAGDAVETTMAILLDAHGYAQPQTAHGDDLVQAGALFDQLKSRKVRVLNEGRDREIVFAPIQVRHRCGHGGGANPVAPDRAYIEAGVAAAAVAITYLTSKLPPLP